MTVVFVNGNPETGEIWAPLLAALDRSDVVLVSPPGFGGPVPDGFGATADEYLAWLVNELEAIGEAVDLVGPLGRDAHLPRGLPAAGPVALVVRRHGGI